MKRAIWGDLNQGRAALLCCTALAALSACSAPANQPAQTPAAAAAAWVTTPLIQSAERSGQGLVLRGVTAPSGRVVVRAAGGLAYATGADSEGRFVLRVGALSSDALFVVETQNGQEAAPAPYRLLVTADSAGPIALLTPGGPSRRLDQTGPLDVIDSDGRALLASGRAEPGSLVSISVNGGPREIQVGADGRWVAAIDGAASQIAVGDRLYSLPSLGKTDSGGELAVASVSGGRLVRWATSPKAAQSSWFPERP